MKHEEIKDQLIFYLENSLTDEEIKMVDKHLEECKECRYNLIRLKEDLQLLEAEKVVAPSPYYFARVKARMTEEKRTSRLYKPWLQPAFFSLLLILAIGGGIVLGKHLSTTPHSRQTITSELMFFDGVQEEPIEQFLLTGE